MSDLLTRRVTACVTRPIQYDAFEYETCHGSRVEYIELLLLLLFGQGRLSSAPMKESQRILSRHRRSTNTSVHIQLAPSIMFVPNLPSVAKRKRAVDEHEHEEHSPTKLVPRRDSILKSEVKPSVRANIEHDDQELSGDEEPEEEQQRISIRDLMKNTRTGKPTKAALERIVRL